MLLTLSLVNRRLIFPTDQCHDCLAMSGMKRMSLSCRFNFHGTRRTVAKLWIWIISGAFKYNMAAIGQLALAVIAGELHEWGIRLKATIFGDASASEREKRVIGGGGKLGRRGRRRRREGRMVEEKRLRAERGRMAQNSLTGCGYERPPSLIGSPPRTRVHVRLT